MRRASTRRRSTIRSRCLFQLLSTRPPTSSTIRTPVRRPREPGPEILAIFNFTPVPRHGYRLGVRRGVWREVLNSDAEEYGGSGVGNLGVIEAVPEPWHGQPASAVLTLPPLGVLWLAPQD